MSTNVLNDPDFVAYAAELEKTHGLTTGLLASLVQQESGGNPEAVGPVTKYGRARGLTQFIDETARTYGLLDDKGDRRTDPRAAVAATARYLADLRKQFGGNEDAALAAYNGGTLQGRLVAGGREPTFAETKDYVQKIRGRLGAVADAGVVQPREAVRDTGPDSSLAAIQRATVRSALVQGLRDPEQEGAHQAAAAKLHQAREATGYTDVVSEALRDPNVMNHDLMEAAVNLVNPTTPVDPNWRYHDHRRQLTAGLTDEQVEIMDELGPDGPDGVAKAQARIQMNADSAKVYGAAGTWATVAGQLTAGSLDIPSWIASLGVGKALHMAKLGAEAFVQAGRARAAVGALVAENVGTELVTTAANDFMGGQMSAGDYLMIPAFAGGLTLPFARGTMRRANQNAINDAIDSIKTKAIELDPVTRTPEERDMAVAAQVKEARADIEAMDLARTKVIPDHIRQDLDEAINPKAPDEALPVADTAVVEMSDEIETLFAKADAEAKAPADAAGPLEFPPIDAPPTPKEEAELVIQAMTQNHLDGKYGDTQDMVASLISRHGKDAFSAEQLDKFARLMVDSKDLDAWRPGDPTPLGIVGGKQVYLGLNTQKERLAQMAADGRAVLKDMTLREALEGIVSLKKGELTHDHGHQALARYMLDTLDKYGDTGLDSMRLLFKKGGERGAAHGSGTAKLPAVAVKDGIHVDITNSALTVRGIVKALDRWSYDTFIHEIVHLVTQNAIDTYRLLPSKLTPEVRAAVERLDSVLERLKEQNRKDMIDPKSTVGRGYAALNTHELLAQALSDRVTKMTLMKMPADPSFGGRFSNMWRQLVDSIKTILTGAGHRGKSTAFDEVAWSFETILHHRGGGVESAGGYTPGWPGNTPPPPPVPRYQAQPVRAEVPEGEYGTSPDVQQAPTPGLQAINPLATVNARRSFAERMVQHAAAWMRQHPIDVRRLSVITDRVGALTDGLVLARSKHPILQLVSTLIVETTTGAAGRGNTAAIHKEMVRTRLLGNTVLDIDRSYGEWKRARNMGLWNDLAHGDNRRRFDREVAVEILNRRETGGPATQDPDILAAADALESTFTRALHEQKAAAILGADRLPETSVGYLPQQLDGRKLANATNADIRELEQHLAQHWATELGWDARFAEQFSSFYVERARARAMNSKGVDLGTTGNSADIIRDTLEAMRETGVNPAAVSLAMRQLAAQSEHGIGQTKARLDVGLLSELPSGRLVLDWYVDDVAGLMNRYVNRTSGVVALTRFGIHGPTGARHLRDSLTVSTEGAEPPTLDELDAFDRVMTEMLGQPIEGAVISRFAANMRQAVGLQRLGGMGFVQAGEITNLATTLGLDSLFSGIASIPRLLGEVGRIKRGAPAGNHLLTHIEAWGGEFGAMSYKMNSPLDPPDDRLNTYVRDSGIVTRALSAGRHLQGKVSMFRAVMAVQHRMVAEQITMKAARMINDTTIDPVTGTITYRGGESIRRTLADMGFDDELVAHFKANMGRVAQWDASGRLVSFDITQVPNRMAAEAFVQGVHRGVGQIIQGTFVGERSKWLHNDYVTLLAQLRTFSITAAEKQWGRQRLNHGYPKAAGMLLAQMALVLPLHAARVQAASVGREDSEEFIKTNLGPAALVRATMNYSSMSGVLGDAFDILAGVAGGWGGSDVKEVLTGRSQTGAGSVLSTIPALGSIEQGHRALMKLPATLTGQESMYSTLKQLPFSNLPGLVQAINLTK